ncbi:MAG: DMT family transporter [Rhodobacteraceae bacterium]|nr:DMT family transporter [Paracoccaceae bacterium]
MTNNLKGALLALAAFGVFATSDVIVKLLGGAYSPVQILFFSTLLGFPLTALLLIRDSTAGTLIPVYPGWMLLRTGAVSVTALCIFYAFSVLPLAQVYAVIFAMPLFITVLSIPVLGEQVGPRRWAAVLVGLCGILVVLRPGQTDFQLGHLAAIVGAFFGSFASVIVRRVRAEERSSVIMLYPTLANVLIMGALLPLSYQPMAGRDLMLSAVMAALAWGANLMLIAAYRKGEAVVVAPMQYCQILWATVYGFFFFDEWPDTFTFAGAGIVMVSGIYILGRESQRSDLSNRPVLRTRSRPETGTTLRVSQFLKPHSKGRKAEDPRG